MCSGAQTSRCFTGADRSRAPCSACCCRAPIHRGADSGTRSPAVCLGRARHQIRPRVDGPNRRCSWTGLLVRMMVRHDGPCRGGGSASAGMPGSRRRRRRDSRDTRRPGDGPLAIAADMLHVLGMAVWLGGLVTLAIARTDEHAYGRVVERFSGLALGAVVVLALTGAFQSIRQFQPFSALWESDYGRLLIAKLVAFGLILLIAAWSRRLVHGPGIGIFGGEAARRRGAGCRVAGARNRCPSPCRPAPSSGSSAASAAS